jgi:hypothetical protein
VNPQERGLKFERRVAELYREFGARRVIHNTIIDGFQIGILIFHELPDGTEIRTIVECKAFSRPVVEWGLTTISYEKHSTN